MKASILPRMAARRSRAADGVVVVAELYVRSGAVIIGDHGLGIYSGTHHLSQVSAKRRIVHAGGKNRRSQL